MTKRVPEKSRYFRGAGHGLRETARPASRSERRSAQFPLRIQERTDWPLPGANTLQWNCSKFLFFFLLSVVCRGRRPRRPVLAPEGSIGEAVKSVKKRAALLHVLAFCCFDLLFGVLRGEQPLSRASRAIGSSGHFFGSFLVSKRNT